MKEWFVIFKNGLIGCFIVSLVFIIPSFLIDVICMFCGKNTSFGDYLLPLFIGTVLYIDHLRKQSWEIEFDN